MSSIDNAKKAMGWKAQYERAGCCNCRHGRLEPAGQGVFPKDRTLCLNGGFYTQRHAICDQWADRVGVRG